MSVGERIRALRTARGLSQVELAAAVGESKQTIYKYEASIITNIPLSKLEAIARALHVSPVELTDWGAEGADGQEDGELMEYLEMLRSRPECRAFLSTAKGASKAEVEENVRFITALRQARKDES